MNFSVKYKNAKPIKNVENIKKIESKFKIKFPKSFLECLNECNEAYISPNKFITIDGQEESVNNFLSFNENDDCYILEQYLDIKEYLPENIYPFATDAFDNCICFDYRENLLEPKVVFFNFEIAYKDKEKSIKNIANSFNDFMKFLY